MNQNTWLSFLTTVIGLAGSAAVTNGLITQSTWTSVGGLIGVVVPFIWGKVIHSDTSVVQAAASVPGVKSVEITTSAPPELQKIAMDPAIPKVQPALPTNTATRR